MTEDAVTTLQQLVSLVARATAVDESEHGEAQAVRGIEAAEAIEQASRAHLQNAVAVARAKGIPWQVIGDALGITRQAAFKRFGTQKTTESGEDTMSKPMIDLTRRTEEVFEQLGKENYAAVKSMMTFTCSRILTRKKVAAVWNQVLTESGQFESCSGTVIQTADGRNVVEQQINQHLGSGLVGQTQVNHEAGEWLGRVAFNGSGKITGMLIVHPMQAQNLPF